MVAGTVRTDKNRRIHTVIPFLSKKFNFELNLSI